MKRAGSILTLFCLFPILGHTAPRQNGSPQIKLIETGEFHEGEVSAKSGQRWLGLFEKDKGFALLPATLKVETITDPVAEEDPKKKTGRRVSVKSGLKPLFLLSGATTLQEGPVTSVYSEETILHNGEVINLKLGKTKYQLKVVGKGSAPADELNQNAKLVLTDGTKSQEVFATGKHDGAGLYLLWAGDLDGDGKLDLYMDLHTHYNTGERRLFLSTKATPGSLLKEVAVFRTIGC